MKKQIQQHVTISIYPETKHKIRGLLLKYKIVTYEELMKIFLKLERQFKPEIMEMKK